MMRNWIILIGVAAAIAAALTWNRLGQDHGSPAAADVRQQSPSGISAQAQASRDAPKKGKDAPAFKLTELDGTMAYEAGGKRDKPLIVNFWASWCGPCDLEAPDLVSLYDKYEGKLDLYAVNATNYDNIRNAREFVQEKGFRFPVLIDDKGKAGNAYQVFAYPTSFIIDRSGKIVERIEGVISKEQWVKYLDPLVKGS